MSKASKSFINYVNNKYKKELNLSKRSVLFYHYDDYQLYMFYDRCKEDYEEYYCQVEEDFRDYSNIQTNFDRNDLNE